MSLATTCPNCGTCFRVVQDQLRVSEGWVRCGNCQNVFNALESLFDLDAPREPLEAPETQLDEPTHGVWQTETSARWMRRRDASSWPEPEVSHTPHLATGADETPEREEPLSDSVRAALHAEPLSSAAAEDNDALHDHDHGEADAQHPGADTAPDARPVESTFSGDWSAPPEPLFAETLYVPREFTDDTAVDTSPPGPAQHDLAEDAAFAAPGLETPPAGSAEPDLFDETGAASDPFNGAGTAPSGEALIAAGVDPEASPEEAPLHATLDTPLDASLTPGAAAVDAPAVEGSVQEAAFDLPDFVRAANRQARWRRPGARIALACTALLFTAALVGQVAWHWRDQLAASWPPAQAPLQTLCAELGCELAAPRRLEALVVDNTTLTRPPGVSGYRLSVHLRNRAEHAVAAPSFDMVLTDGQGAVLSRRVIHPEDFDFREAALEAQAEALWTLEFALNEGSLVGYTLAAFYP